MSLIGSNYGIEHMSEQINDLCGAGAREMFVTEEGCKGRGGF
jgi:hypothetical protein